MWKQGRVALTDYALGVDTGVWTRAPSGKWGSVVRAVREAPQRRNHGQLVEGQAAVGLVVDPTQRLLCGDMLRLGESFGPSTLGLGDAHPHTSTHARPHTHSYTRARARTRMRKMYTPHDAQHTCGPTRNDHTFTSCRHMSNRRLVSCSEQNMLWDTTKSSKHLKVTAGAGVGAEGGAGDRVGHRTHLLSLRTRASPTVALHGGQHPNTLP